jgi:hypothetical protein
MHLAVMPWREQQQYREQLMRVPGLYACWCMRRCSVSMYSNSAQGVFDQHLVAGRVTRFELIFAYVGLRREVNCFYTILDFNTIFREVPLRIPHLHFREDGQEVHLVEGAPAWNAILRDFHVKLLPFLLVATVKSLDHDHDH